MLPRADLSSIRPVAAIDAPTAVVTIADAKHEAVGRLAQIALGQQVQAKVLSALDDGTFLVRVAGATLRMNLPADAKVGQSLLLTMAGTTPRPTFLLPGAENAAATSTLSPTARLIDQLLQGARRDGASDAVRGTTPLLQSASAPAAQVAGALREAVSYSGLFYESHLAQWVTGNRNLAQILREPQAQQARQLATPNATLSARAAAAVAAGTVSNAANVNTAADGTLATATTAGSQASTNPTTAQLIPLQLDTLENQRMMWRGELWPGQPLEWEISRDAPEGGSDATPEAEASWQSVVRFELPLLGTVSGALRLTGQRLQLQLRTDSEAAALLLRTHGGALEQALSAAGSNLESLSVKHDGSRS